MKKIFSILFFLFASMNVYSQNPTYTLDATNFAYYSNYIEWDIYISQTNPPTTFEYAGGQYFFSFNALITTGLSNLSYRIVPGSDLPSNMQPRGPSVGNASNPSQTVLRLAVNTFPGAGNGFIMTNNGIPGTRIIRVKLATVDSTPFVQGEPFNLQWRNPPIIAFATKVYAYVGTANTDITTPSTHLINGIANNFIRFNMTVLMEGMYNNLFNMMNRTDSVDVYLRSASSPYSIVDSASGKIDSVSFTNTFSFPHATSSGTFYIVPKHFNTIETWSKSGGEVLLVTTVGNYNFTTAASQAFGDNMKLKGTKYTMYSGDVNQDGIIDGTDLSAIDNDAYNLLVGVDIPTDLNADNIVDASDFLIGDNNRRYITVISP